MDIFTRARQMHQNGTALGGQPPVGGPPHIAGAPGKGPGPVSNMNIPKHDYNALAKKFGLNQIKLDANPVVARTQLMQHLQQKFGPGYMSQPGVDDLLSSLPQSHDSAPAASTQTQQNVKALMGK